LKEKRDALKDAYRELEEREELTQKELSRSAEIVRSLTEENLRLNDELCNSRDRNERLQQENQEWQKNIRHVKLDSSPMPQRSDTTSLQKISSAFAVPRPSASGFAKKRAPMLSVFQQPAKKKAKPVSSVTGLEQTKISFGKASTTKFVRIEPPPQRKRPDKEQGADNITSDIEFM
jgi:hypothetical protein